MIQNRRRRPWTGERQGECAKCGREMRKMRMVALYMKESSYVNPAKLCHVCQDCLPDLLDYLGAEMPERPESVGAAWYAL